MTTELYFIFNFSMMDLALPTVSTLELEKNITLAFRAFYSLLNYPPRYNACLANFNLFALCNYNELNSAEGKNEIVGKIVSEMRELQSKGIWSRNVGWKKFLWVSSLIHWRQPRDDGWMGMMMFNIIESFSGDYCCILWYATCEEMQHFDKEINFKLHTKADWLRRFNVGWLTSK